MSSKSLLHYNNLTEKNLPLHPTVPKPCFSNTIHLFRSYSLLRIWIDIFFNGCRKNASLVIITPFIINNNYNQNSYFHWIRYSITYNRISTSHEYILVIIPSSYFSYISLVSMLSVYYFCMLHWQMILNFHQYPHKQQDFPYSKSNAVDECAGQKA